MFQNKKINHENINFNLSLILFFFFFFSHLRLEPHLHFRAALHYIITDIRIMEHDAMILACSAVLKWPPKILQCC